MCVKLLKNTKKCTVSKMKKATIQEAIKANEHSRVRTIFSQHWREAGYFKKKDHGYNVFQLSIEEILGDWEIEEKPREAFVLMHSDGEIISAFLTKEKADSFIEARLAGFFLCVKMREVVE